MENILNFNPIKRLTASQCLQHPFFQCFDILSVYGLNINYSQAHGSVYNFSKEPAEATANFVYNANSNNSNYGSNNPNKSKETALGIINSSANNLNSDFNNEKKKIKSSNTVNFINSLNSNSNYYNLK